MRAAVAAELIERSVLEIVLLDRQTAGDVFSDRHQPLQLLGGERVPFGLLFAESLGVTLFDRHADRAERRVGVDGVTDQRFQAGDQFSVVLFVRESCCCPRLAS